MSLARAAGLTVLAALAALAGSASGGAAQAGMSPAQADASGASTAGAEATAETPATPESAATAATEDERELLALLAEETDIATRTRMNGDYVPGIVTVLHGEELEALGVHSAWEALSLVPGVQVVRDAQGSPSLTIRGIDFIFNTGNTKVLVNGVAMSRESAGVNNAVLLLPVEQIERIEVIRGPGSAIHGDFAFQGLVNVVTRQDRDSVSVRAHDPSSFLGVVEQAWGREDGRVRASLSLAALESDDADAPSPARADESRRVALLGVGGRFGTFRAQMVGRDFDPEPGPGVPPALSEESWALAWGGRFALGGAWSLDARAARSATENDLLPRLLFEGDVTELGLDVVREGRRHDTLVGVAWWSGDIDHARIQPPPPAGPLDVFGQDRRVRSITFQEQVRPHDSVSVTVGARWDDFSDVGSEVSPRLALVWRAAERHVVKAQHAEAFRAPTFFEQAAPSPDPDPERMATTELGWIHRRPSTVVRATAFRSRLVDGLGPGPMGPANDRDADVRGIEAEWTQSWTSRVKLVTNVAWADPHAGSLIFGWSEWLANVAVVATPTRRLTLGARWHHVGTRRSSAAKVADGYDWVDATVTVDDLGVEGFSLRGGVKNALGDAFAHPIPTPNGSVRPTYDGRTTWLALAYRW